MNLEERLIEQLSEEVHNAGMKEKIEQGFHYPHPELRPGLRCKLL